MRLVSWNILKGGGERSSHIIEQLCEWNANVVGLSEFRGTRRSKSIAAALRDMGLVHQLSTVDSDAPELDRLLLASRQPLTHHPPTVLPDLGRWIHVSIDKPSRLSLVLLWVPNRDKSGVKYTFHELAVNALLPLAGTRALAFGDTNSGIRGLDDETPFFNAREREWFAKLADAGWADCWRCRNGDQRQYTWHSTNGGAGFRLDQVFVTNSMDAQVKSVRYDWGKPPFRKLRGPSDHAAIVIDLEECIGE